MKNLLGFILAFIFFFLFCSETLAVNSLVNPNGLRKMKDAGISQTVIDLLISEQTCSVTPDFLVSLREAGADDKVLEKVILGDRYNNPQDASSIESTKEILKSSGFSNEMIEDFYDGPAVKTEKDSQGNEHVIYKTGAGQESSSSTPEAPPFNINIERVEKK